MSVNVHLESISAIRLRCPDYDIKLADSNGLPYSIVMLQMPNGTGKTTTLELLRAAFAGPSVLTDEPREYVDSEQVDGYFQVKFINDSKRYTITIKFDSELNEVIYSTTLPSSGIADGHNMPAELKPFFHPDFVKLFVFDGELAEQLLDHESTNAEQAIEALFQLNEFDKLINLLDGYYEQKSANTSTDSDIAATKAKNKRDKFENLLNKVRALFQQDTSDFEAAVKLFESLNSEYAEKLKLNDELNEKMKLANLNLKVAADKVKGFRKDAFDKLKHPYAITEKFAQGILNLKNSFDQAKLPEGAAREFFLELADNESECICGTELSQELRQAIRERAGQYLGSDDMGYINTLKSSIVESIGKVPGEHVIEFNNQIAELTEAMADEQAARNEVGSIEAESAYNDPDLKSVLESIQKSKERIKELTDRLELYNQSEGHGPEEKWLSLPALKREFERYDFKYAEISNTIELKAKRDLLRVKLRNARAKARFDLASQVCTDANARIQTLMPYNDILISKIDKSLHLKRKSGGSKAGGSIGETLSVAYAFLSTLFNSANAMLPFIVDSPANAIDLSVRTQVGHFIPKIAHQVIAFTISSERQNFIEALRESAEKDGKSIEYYTMFREGSNELKKLAESCLGHKNIGNGFIIPGKSFFDSFQISEAKSE